MNIISPSKWNSFLESYATDRKLFYSTNEIILDNFLVVFPSWIFLIFDEAVSE